MSRTDPQLRVRLPPEIRDWLERNAAQNRRSINGEIIICVEEAIQRSVLAEPAQAAGSP
jgi:hypothetical protein